MRLGAGIIKSAMARRGFKHRTTEDRFTIDGQYARNLQYVYSRETTTSKGKVVDLIYFAVDLLSEKLVIGLYRENPRIENGVCDNAARSIRLQDYTKENIEKELDRLIPPVHSRLKKGAY